MTASLEAAHHPIGSTSGPQTRPGRVRRFARAAGRSTVYCAALIPVAIASVIVALFGQARVAVRWWRWLRVRLLGAPSVPATRRPGVVSIIVHALPTVLLGAAALVPLAIEVLFILRGVFYGLVDHGPYTTSWGGPTLAGAWLAHFVVAVPGVLAASGALIGIAAVHQRLTRSWLDDGSRALWVTPVTLVISVAAGLFFVLWLRQLPQ